MKLVRKVSTPGLNIEVEVNRIGMSGTLAYEIRGLKEHGPNVYHAFGGYPCSNCKISIK